MGTVDLLTQPRRVTSTQLFSDPKSVALQPQDLFLSLKNFKLPTVLKPPKFLL